MNAQNETKLKLLEQKVPEGLLVTASWLSSHGYYSSLRSQYLKSGWLEQPAHGVFRRPYGAPGSPLRWEQVVISLQALMGFPVVVGGRTALEMQGYAHFLSHEVREVHLYSDERLPGWIGKLPIHQKFTLHKSTRLFPAVPVEGALRSLDRGHESEKSVNLEAPDGGFTVLKWGQWEWPLVVSSLERAVFELLDELPTKESFHVTDKLFEGLASLRPKRLNQLLTDCRSVKVKRLFLYFSDRHQHAWNKYLDREGVDLGSGDRMLVRGGKFDPVYRITVPEDFDAVQ